MIREIINEDFNGLMQLYMQLHGESMPGKTPEIMEVWNRILEDKEHHIIIDRITASPYFFCYNI